MSFKGKVKALLEGGEGTRDHPGGRGKTRVVGQEERGEDLQSLIHSLIYNAIGPGSRPVANAQHNGHAPTPKKSQTENSNHPFYQKVKVLLEDMDDQDRRRAERERKQTLARGGVPELGTGRFRPRRPFVNRGSGWGASDDARDKSTHHGAYKGQFMSALSMQRPEVHNQGADDRGKSMRQSWRALVAKALGSEKSQTKPKKEKSSDESQTENSNHPFYQKVKALSRGKKNNSLLERKSKTIKVLIARIKPCEKKSKMDEEKKKSKKKYWEPSFGLNMDDQEAIKKAVAAEHEAFIQSEKKLKEKSKKGKAKSKKGKQDADDDRPKDLEDPHEGKPPQRLAPRYRRPEKKKPPPITGNTIEVTRALIARRHKKK